MKKLRQANFQIVPIAVGQGELGLCRMPGHGGDFAGDLSVILDWHPQAVLTLAEGAELDKSGASELGQKLADMGIEWFHLPIPDYGVPVDADGARLSNICTKLSQLLARNARIVIHCRAGCGRTGMIALRLMALQGEDAGHAFRRLRQARPCAIETAGQLEWAAPQLRGAFCPPN